MPNNTGRHGAACLRVGPALRPRSRKKPAAQILVSAGRLLQGLWAALEGQIRTLWTVYGTNLPRQQCSPDDVAGRQSANLLDSASSAAHYRQRRGTIFCSQCRPTNAHTHRDQHKGTTARHRPDPVMRCRRDGGLANVGTGDSSRV